MTEPAKLAKTFRMNKFLLLALLSLPAHANGNLASWFEIPVTDMARATAFYEKILDVKLAAGGTREVPMAMFPKGGEGTVSGALIKMNTMHPGAEGPLVYLNGGDDLEVVANRIPAAGGKILVPKTLISKEIGCFAVFLDTEGNKLGLFSAH